MRVTMSVSQQAQNGHWNQAGSFNKVGCIKAVRLLTGLGLKEAKDLVEAAMVSPQTFTVSPRTIDVDRKAALRDLEKWGASLSTTATSNRKLVLEAMREMAMFAMTVNEFELAERLTRFLREEMDDER